MKIPFYLLPHCEMEIQLLGVRGSAVAPCVLLSTGKEGEAGGGRREAGDGRRETGGGRREAGSSHPTVPVSHAESARVPIAKRCCSWLQSCSRSHFARVSSGTTDGHRSRTADAGRVASAVVQSPATWLCPLCPSLLLSCSLSPSRSLALSPTDRLPRSRTVYEHAAPPPPPSLQRLAPPQV